MAIKTLKEIMGMEPEDLVQDPYEDAMGDHVCPDCGAPEGAECDCVVDDEDPRDYNDARYDAERAGDMDDDVHVRPTLRPVGEGVQEFDKFMDKILISEGHGRKPTPEEDNPQRRRAAKHQDRPGNKTRFGSK